VIVELGEYRLEIAEDFGPRIVGFSRRQSPQVFAVLSPDVVLKHAHGVYRFRGGHRVWAAPEVPDITYASDDHRCEVIRGEFSVQVLAPPDASGVIKKLTASVEGDRLAVESRLEFAHQLGVEVAAWAISQFPLGGLAILPLTGVETNPLPNRRLVLWPYTDLSDPRLEFRGDCLVINASDGPKLKVGAGIGTTRLGYFRDGFLFTKEVPSTATGKLPDHGARSQVFAGAGFCELETVSGLSPADIGVSLSVVEIWAVSECQYLDEAVSTTSGSGAR
jgi:hypothetical protein